jgi:predicted outer membrane protein
MVAAPACCMCICRGVGPQNGETIMSKRYILILIGLAAVLATSAAFAQSGNKTPTDKATASSTQQDERTEAEKRAERRARAEAAAAKAKQQGDDTRKSGAEEEEEESDKP